MTPEAQAGCVADPQTNGMASNRTQFELKYALTEGSASKAERFRIPMILTDPNDTPNDWITMIPTLGVEFLSSLPPSGVTD